MKGMRVQSIIRELRGEKIDIIEYSEDPVVFATHSLSPAKISRVTIVSPLDKHMEVIVDDSQLSLAIGKKGQNVRLAAKLLGWKVDIKSEEEKRQEVESAMAALTNTGEPVSVLIDYGLSEPLAEKLVEAGVGTIEKLGGMTPEELLEIPGVDPEVVERIRDILNAYYGQFEEGAAAAQPELQETVESPTDVAAGPAAEETATPYGDVSEEERPAESAETGEQSGIDPAGEFDTIKGLAPDHNESEESGS
jgi:N utilization substance protein A